MPPGLPKILGRTPSSYEISSKPQVESDEEEELKCPICDGDIEDKFSRRGTVYFQCSFQGNLRGPLPYLGATNVGATFMAIEEHVHDSFKTIKGGKWPQCHHNDPCSGTHCKYCK